MAEELKDKVDAQQTVEERRQQLDERYPEYVSDLVQEESDAVKSKATSAAEEYFKK